MRKGLLVYNRDDFLKNNWFAQKIKDTGLNFNLEIDIVLSDEINLIIGEEFLVLHRNKKLPPYDFIINRTRSAYISKHFEAMACVVFNSSHVTEMCNDKAKTHQFINQYGIKSIETHICQRNNLNNIFNEKFPLIIKSVSGHGGNEVYKAENEKELFQNIAKLQENNFIIQKMSSVHGMDIRVYVVNNQIIAAVKRKSINDFRSNIAVGGTSEQYILNSQEKATVQKICDLMHFDFVGIDFILDEQHGLLFNEIEDVVGCRALYNNYSIEIIDLFLGYIDKTLAQPQIFDNYL